MTKQDSGTRRRRSKNTDPFMNTLKKSCGIEKERIEILRIQAKIDRMVGKIPSEFPGARLCSYCGNMDIPKRMTQTKDGRFSHGICIIGHLCAQIVQKNSL